MYFKIKPWDHQLTALDRFEKRNNRFLCCHEMGSGKTATGLFCMRSIYHREHRVPLSLIVCPGGVMEHWKRQAKAHCEPEIANEFCLLEGTGKQRMKLLERSSARVFVVNFEATRMADFWKELTKIKFEFLIVDESHRIKSHKTLQHKKIVEIADKCKAVLAMTGTPITNTAQDIWGQLRVLANGCVSENFYVWLRQNFYDANAGKSWLKFPDWKLLPGRAKNIAQTIAENSHTVKTAECIDMPPFVRSEVFVDLDERVERMYRELEEDFITFLDTGEPVVANLAITKMLRLQQFCNGSVVSEEGKKQLPCEKITALQEIFETLGPDEKRVVWCNFLTPIEHIVSLCESMKLKCVVYSGKQSREDKRSAKEAFIDDPEVKVFIGTQAAGGTGLDGLQIAKYAIYYSKNYNLEQDLQSQARTYRGGSNVHSVVTRIDIVTRNTVEEKINEALARKLKLADLLTSIKGDSNINSVKVIQENDFASDNQILQMHALSDALSFAGMSLDVDGY